MRLMRNLELGVRNEVNEEFGIRNVWLGIMN
jgi:hypothetical protein